MSKFLGPIHYWLYNKIAIQNNINKQIAILNNTYSQNESAYVLPTLEDAIDTTNIHGWLQQKIDYVEDMTARNVMETLKSATADLSQLKELFYKAGASITENLSVTSPKDFYQLLNDTLLDGMPCDHVNRVLTETETDLTYQKTGCVHKKYWENIGADPMIYHTLREELIRGMAENFGLTHSKATEDTFVIERTV